MCLATVIAMGLALSLAIISPVLSFIVFGFGFAMTVIALFVLDSR
jgi:hypothetical protein